MNENSILFQAVANNEIDLVKEICQRGFNEKYWAYEEENSQWLIFSTALGKAVENQNIEIVKILLDSDRRKVNFIKHDCTIEGLHIAYCIPNLSICDLLWESLKRNHWGVNADEMADFLFAAISSKNMQAIEHVLNRGVNVNHPTGDGLPLIMAVQENDLNLVKLLIKYGADPNLRQDNYSGALFEAAYYNFLEIYQYLLHFSSDENELEHSKAFLGYPSTWLIEDREVGEWDECYGDWSTRPIEGREVDEWDECNDYYLE